MIFLVTIVLNGEEDEFAKAVLYHPAAPTIPPSNKSFLQSKKKGKGWGFYSGFEGRRGREGDGCSGMMDARRRKEEEEKRGGGGRVSELRCRDIWGVGYGIGCAVGLMVMVLVRNVKGGYCCPKGKKKQKGIKNELR